MMKNLLPYAISGLLIATTASPAIAETAFNHASRRLENVSSVRELPESEQRFVFDLANQMWNGTRELGLLGLDEKNRLAARAQQKIADEVDAYNRSMLMKVAELPSEVDSLTQLETWKGRALWKGGWDQWARNLKKTTLRDVEMAIDHRYNEIGQELATRYKSKALQSIQSAGFDTEGAAVLQTPLDYMEQAILDRFSREMSMEVFEAKKRHAKGLADDVAFQIISLERDNKIEAAYAKSEALKEWLGRTVPIDISINGLSPNDYLQNIGCQLAVHRSKATDGDLKRLIQTGEKVKTYREVICDGSRGGSSVTLEKAGLFSKKYKLIIERRKGVKISVFMAEENLPSGQNVLKATSISSDTHAAELVNESQWGICYRAAMFNFSSASCPIDF